MQLLDQLGGQLAAEHGDRPAGQVNVQVLPHLDLELAAVQAHGDRAVAAAQARTRRRRRSRRCPRTASPRRRARRCARGCASGVELGVPGDVGAVGKQLGGARSAGRRRAGRAPRARRRRRSRIAHCGLPIETCWKRHSRPAGARARRAVVRRPDGKSLEVQPRAAHVDAARASPGDRRPDLAGGGLDREGVGVGPAAAAQVHDRLAGAVARELGLRAVGVEDPQLGHEAALARAARAAARRRRRRRVGVAQPATRAGVSSKGSSSRLDDEVVVAERLPLLELHGARESTRARICRATSRGSRPVTSIGSTPASLRIHVSWRRA